MEEVLTFDGPIHSVTGPVTLSDDKLHHILIYPFHMTSDTPTPPASDAFKLTQQELLLREKEVIGLREKALQQLESQVRHVPLLEGGDLSYSRVAHASLTAGVKGEGAGHSDRPHGGIEA